MSAPTTHKSGPAALGHQRNQRLGNRFFLAAPLSIAAFFYAYKIFLVANANINLHFFLL
jgi:hypothetical protein